jgi:hypothetical protein
MTTMRKLAMAAALLAGMTLPALANDEFKLNPSNDARKLLVYYHGKTVTLQLGSGKEITGTVATVGEHMVQLSRLSGREFYDAAVDYDHIEAVIVKAREK